MRPISSSRRDFDLRSSSHPCTRIVSAHERAHYLETIVIRQLPRCRAVSTILITAGSGGLRQRRCGLKKVPRPNSALLNIPCFNFLYVYHNKLNAAPRTHTGTSIYKCRYKVTRVRAALHGNLMVPRVRPRMRTRGRLRFHEPRRGAARSTRGPPLFNYRLRKRRFREYSLRAPRPLTPTLMHHRRRRYRAIQGIHVPPPPCVQYIGISDD